MSVRRSTYFAFGSRYANTLINFVAIVVIARLLTPAEIGIFTVSAAFVTLTQVLRDFGIGNYLIQERDLDRTRVRTAMGIGLLIGGGLALLMVALARPIAGFYGEPGMADVLYILAVNFLLTPANAVGLALLKRRMSFGTVLWFELAGNLSWAVVAVALAHAGESYRSLAWGSLAGAIFMLAAFLIFRPGLVLVRPSLAAWRRVAGFGSLNTAANMVTQIGVLSPAIIMGRLLGFSDVAFYNRGNGLTKMFRETIESGARSVALPAFAAQLRKGDFDKAGYLYTTTLITGISWPFFCLLGLMAYPVLRILYGDQWDAAVPVVQFLALCNIINAVTVLAGHVMIAVGAVKLVLYKEIFIQGLRIVLTVACSFHSFEAVAAAQIVVYLAALVINHVYLNRLVGLTVADVAGATGRSLAVTIVSAAAPILVAVLLPASPNALWLPFLLATAGAAAGWLAAVFVFDHPARNEISILFRKTRSFAALPRRA